jgi:hypothetical protein
MADDLTPDGFPSAALVRSHSRWSAPTDTSLPRDFNLVAPALQHPGLMTQAIRYLYGTEPQVECAFEGPDDSPPSARVRQIRLFAGHRLCLLATSLIPVVLIDRHPWLDRLGNHPLGETIARHAGVQRNEFLIWHGQGVVSDTGFDSPGPVWARRYTFDLDNEQIQVAELFHPGYLRDLAGALRKIAGHKGLEGLVPGISPWGKCAPR